MGYKVGDKITITNYNYVPLIYSRASNEFIGKTFTIKSIRLDNPLSKTPRNIYYLDIPDGSWYVLDEWIVPARSFKRTWRYLTKEERI